MTLTSSSNYRLYHYWRSTSSWRIRWAMLHKGISVEYVAVSLLDGESESDTHRLRNPMGYVPVLEFLKENRSERRYLVESLAILRYLEEAHPDSPLLPEDVRDRAHVWSLAETINASTQPLQNLSTLIELSPENDPPSLERRKKWSKYWIHRGLTAYEELARSQAGRFSFGDHLTVADLCLIPQIYNAFRNEMDLEDFPTLSRVYSNAIQLESYRRSEPDQFKPEQG